MKLKVIIHEAEEGGYWAEVPSIEGYVLSLEEDGLPVPDEHFEALAVAV